MTYIIDNANILKDDELIVASLLIKQNKIAYMSKHFKKYLFTRMNAEPYIMTPTYVLFDSLNEMKSQSFEESKKYFLQHFIKQGCTTVLTYVDVKYESEISQKLKTIKTKLLNSPIDYIIGVKVPLKLITPSFIRYCKREKIPAIFIDLDQEDQLSEVPWGWIRESLFPYNSPLIPIFSNHNLDDKQCSRLLHEWKSILKEQKINHFDAPLAEGIPLNTNALSQLGIFPFKSSIIQGGEVSYNLYLRNREIKKIDTSSLFQYHKDKLLITVHKGMVIRAAETELVYRPGFGEHVAVKMPSFFSYS
jgi:hypothetical protein